MGKILSESIANATLSEMANADIRKMDYDELTDLSEIEINSNLPVKERVKQFVEKVGNPYCYISHGVKIKLSFSGEKSLADCLASCMSLGATMFGTENHTSIGDVVVEVPEKKPEAA